MHYLSYWLPEQLDNLPDDPLMCHAASDQYLNINPGDTVWVVTVNPSSRKLMLLAPLRVSERLSDSEARRQHGRDLYQAKWHIFTADNEAEAIRCLDINNIASRLRFVSDTNDRLPVVQDGGVRPQRLQRMRCLTNDTASLLERIWEESASVDHGLVVGKQYKRTAIHERFGGQRQGGISTPQRHPFVFLFSSQSGEKYGYSDGFQSDGVYWYTGEGQKGDMKIVRGNQAIRDHVKNGKELLLFEQAERSFVTFLGRAKYLSNHKATAPDVDGKNRKAIVFELELCEGSSGLPAKLQTKPKKSPVRLPRTLEELRSNALTAASPLASTTERKRIQYVRSEAIKAYVRKRASGRCECCGKTAPFISVGGEPFLEAHHIRRRSDGGPDHPRWVAAICPNCHREVHFGKKGDSLNSRMTEYIGRIES